MSEKLEDEYSESEEAQDRADLDFYRYKPCIELCSRDALYAFLKAYWPDELGILETHAAAVAALEADVRQLERQIDRMANRPSDPRLIAEVAAHSATRDALTAALARLAEVESALTAVTHAPIDGKAQDRLAALKQIASMALSQEKRGENTLTNSSGKS